MCRDPWKPSVGVRSLRVTGSGQAWVIGAKLGSSNKQPEFLTAELSLKNHNCIFVEVLTLSVKDFGIICSFFTAAYPPKGHNN